MKNMIQLITEGEKREKKGRRIKGSAVIKGLFLLLGATTILLGSVIISPTIAWANYFVCSVKLEPHSTTTLGSYGYLAVDIYSEPSCTGSLVVTGFVVSSNASTTSDSNYEYNTFHLLELYDQLINASMYAMPVTYSGKWSSGYYYFKRFTFKAK